MNQGDETDEYRGRFRSPHVLDLNYDLSKAFWGWLLSQVWIYKFVGWEEIFASAEPPRYEVLLSAEDFFEQIRRLFQIEFCWHNIRTPSLREGASWLRLMARFTAFTRPWIDTLSVADFRSVIVSRPADLLWVGAISTRLCPTVYCYDEDTRKTIESFFPRFAKALILPMENVLHTIPIASKHDLAEFAKLLRSSRLSSSRPLQPRYLGSFWSANADIGDADLHAFFEMSMPWRKISGEQRRFLRCAESWMYSAEGSKLADPCYRRLFFTEIREAPEAGAIHHDLTTSPYAEMLAERLLNLAAEPPPAELTINLFQTVHSRLFKDIYAHAGSLRKSNRIAVAGVMTTVDPSFLSTELRSLLAMWNQGSARVLERNELISLISWFHFRFQLIHPFEDGNGHIGRFLLSAQATLLGKTFDPTFWNSKRDSYRNAMQADHRLGRPTTFYAWVAKEVGTVGAGYVELSRGTPVFRMQEGI